MNSTFSCCLIATLISLPEVSNAYFISADISFLIFILQIESHKVDFKEKAAPKIGSLDNADHKPGGGNVEILDEKLEFRDKASPKVIVYNIIYSNDFTQRSGQCQWIYWAV